MTDTTRELEGKVAAIFDSFAAAVSTAGTFADREREALRLANELVRRWSQRELEMIEARHGDMVKVDGDVYRRHSSGQVRYHTLCGSVKVSRGCYRKVGVHNGPTVIPLELEVGILQRATPALAKSVVLGFATMPLRQYEDEMKAAERVVPSRTALDKIGKRVSEALLERRALIEPAQRQCESIHCDAFVIAVGLDRTTIPMSELDPESGKVVVSYRMAYVATIAPHDRAGKALVTRRVSATAAEGPHRLAEGFLAEVGDLRAKYPTLPFLVVQDGAPELWNLVERWLASLDIEPTWRLIDRFHLDERLAKTCDALTRIPAVRKAQYTRWRRKLDRDDEAADAILRAHERQIYARKTPLTGERLKTVEQNKVYLQHNTKRMNYAQAKRDGVPIGSGVTEGACKSVITMRFKRSGQRWSQSGSAACLYARTLHLNGRLMSAIDHLEHVQQTRIN